MPIFAHNVVGSNICGTNVAVNLQTIWVGDLIVRAEWARRIPEVGIVSEHENSLLIHGLVLVYGAVNLPTIWVRDLSERARRVPEVEISSA
jgi:hypothetical protein